MSQPKHADDKRRALHNYFLRSQTRSQSNTPSLTTNSTLSSSSNSALISPVDFEALSFEPQPELLCSKSKPGVDSIIASMRQIGEELDRTPTNLQKAGYNPVWTSVLGYPGEIPEDLKEFICPEVEQGNYLVNQLSSTFWLKGDKFLNELIRDPESLFPFFRSPIPPQIHVAKLNWNRNQSKFAKEIENVLGNTVRGRKLYRGVTQKAVVSLMALFCPVHSSSCADNEFGPGIYTSPSLQAAMTYCIPGSALLVFEDPQNLLRHTLRGGGGWDTVVCFWTGLQVGDLATRVPPNWRGVDILEGAISRGETGRGV
ncbi:unnamed protein product [Penicillium salamii]|nr:unnamed protein product [Penicillium salamii]CAG8168642.1 unnamed protein product [Penicillium salamii]CAG8247586.1 unnamed protein product [Penicillium salamii]